MAFYSRTRSDLAPVLGAVKSAGPIRPAQAWPLHTLSSDGRFGVFVHGGLSLLFQVRNLAAFSPAALLEAIPWGGGFQFYRHRTTAGQETAFLAVSAPIPYSYRFSALKGLSTVFRFSYVSRELAKLEEATEAVRQALLAAAAGSLSPEDAEPQEGFERLLAVLGGVPQKETPPAFNLTFLLLPDGRLGLLGDTVSFPAIPAAGLPLPPAETESLLCTSLFLPEEAEHGKLRAASEDLQAFERQVHARGPLFQEASPGGPILRRNRKGRRLAFVRQYYLLLSESPTLLQKAGDDYFDALNAAGYPVHPSLVSSQDHFCHLHPGNYRVFLDGTLVSSVLLDSLFERLLP